jgi:hypothetical protein
MVSRKKVLTFYKEQNNIYLCENTDFRELFCKARSLFPAISSAKILKLFWQKIVARVSKIGAGA